MVFMPQQSLVLVNKSEVLPKSLDKTAAGRQGEQAPVLGRGEHMSQISKAPAYMGTSYTQLRISPLANLAAPHSSKNCIWPSS